MIAISLRFPAGRYHATPWGRHVNEGEPEWPPSPWRFLRALVAVWKRKVVDLPEEVMRRILEALREPPYFRLPPASSGHTRHYMPWDKNWSSQRHAAKTLVFDTFVVIDRDEEVRVYWPQGRLGPEDRQGLARLLDALSYLGRAESWCEACLVEAAPDWAGEVNARPTGTTPGAGGPGDGMEVVRLLVPAADLAMDRLDDGHPLFVRTTHLRKSGRLAPPGGVWLNYLRPKEALDPVRVERPRTEDAARPQLFRYRLDASPLPPVTDTLRIGDLARLAAMSCYGRANAGRGSPLLSGRDEEGPLEDHGHCFYLPIDSDADSWIEELILYAPSGFDAPHREALHRLRRLVRREEVEIRLLPLGAADTPATLAGLPAVGPAKIWVSATPFLLTRHPKVRRSGRWHTEPIPKGLEIALPEDLGRFRQPEHLLHEYGVDVEGGVLLKDGPAAQLLLAIERRRLTPFHSLPRLTRLVPRPRVRRRGRALRWLDFKRFRRYKQRPACGVGYGFELHFSEPLHGPLALGYACHQGLGLFLPAEESEPRERTG